MENTESDLLVDIFSNSNFLEGANGSITDNEYNVNNLKESLVEYDSNAGIPDHEGNINGAMDLFAPDWSSILSDNSRISNASVGGQQIRSSSSEPKDTSDSDRPLQLKTKRDNSYKSLMNENEQLDSVSIASDSSAGDIRRSIISPQNQSSIHYGQSKEACPSPHFPKSNITFPSVSRSISPSMKQWAVFGDGKENTMPQSSPKPKHYPVRPPPAVPERKSLKRRVPIARASPLTLPPTSSSPSADLLSMDMNDLKFHLSDACSPVLDHSSAKPAVPPRKSLFPTFISSSEMTCSEDLKQDLISLPEPEGHINHAHSSSTSSSPIPGVFLPKRESVPGPPIPPRKNAPRIKLFPAANNSQSQQFDFDPFSCLKKDSELDSHSLVLASPSWVNFGDDGGCSEAETSEHSILVQDKSLTLENSDVNHVEGINLNCDQVSDPGSLIQEVEESLWTKPPSSPDVKITGAKKKVSGGIGYHCLENDDLDNMESNDNIDLSNPTLEKVTISPPENDLSPEKPQSQWATFQNEDDEEDHVPNDFHVDNVSCGGSSLPSLGMNSSGFAGSLNDVDLEDDFGIAGNRLSVELPNLKGFNRADRGSQNNLVDFSDDRGSAAVSIGSHDGDEDVETIFDLTAQGDTLKRKRRKGSIIDESVSHEDITDGVHVVNKKKDSVDSANGVSFHVGPAGVDDSVFADEINISTAERDKICPPPSVLTLNSNCSSRVGTPMLNESCASSAMPTNPFWSPPIPRSLPSSGSQSSSAESPFDNIVFVNSKPSTPLRINPVSHASTPVPLVRIPPPPQSHSRSSSRQRGSSQSRTRNTSLESNSARRLDLGGQIDTSDGFTKLSSSRAQTPNQIGKESISDCHSSSAPIEISKDIFDPFSNHSAINSTSSNDVFSFFEDIHTDSAMNESGADDGVATTCRDDGSNTIFQFELSNEDTAHKNTNSNANIDALTREKETNRKDEEDYQNNDLTVLLSPVPDPSSELNNVGSVESPIQLTKNSSLPEIDIVDSRFSWDAFMRFPPTKRTMSNRKWVPIHVKLICEQVDDPKLQLYYLAESKDPFRTLSLSSHQMQMTKPKLQAHYTDDGQVMDKLHSVKLILTHYKEKQAFSPRRNFTRSAAGFKHACKGKQSIKLGFKAYNEVVSFVKVTRDAMFYAHKLVPKMKKDEHVTTVKYHSRDEFVIDVCDELQAVVDESGNLEACKLRVHLFIGSFLSGDPMAKIAINDRKLEGREVVRRQDIIPTSLDGWIDVVDLEMHECCTPNSMVDDNVGICSLHPPDACRFELMRFTTNYTENELPVVVSSNIVVKGAKLKLKSTARICGNHSAFKDPLKQIPCDDVMIRFPVPDEWSAFFKVEGKFRNHTVKAKRAAKPRIKAPIAGVTMVASIGVAKYEKPYSAIVWRIPRLPEKNAVLNTPHVFECTIELVSDQDLERLQTSNSKEDDSQDVGIYSGQLDPKFKSCEVEFDMVGPTASKVCVRSVCLPNTDRAEKFVIYQSHYFYKVGIGVSVKRITDEGEADPADFCTTQ